ncbi:unnamed protein product [Closterium sp. Naga37s-1]|nr:unnamed protein product [Closterium sp. Naga37s-1]
MVTGDGLAGRVTLTTDIWTSENKIAFMVVTAHRLTEDFKLQQMVIDFRPLEGSHTGEKIATELEAVIREWGLGDLFFGVTTDNAENNNRAVRLLAGVKDNIPGSRPRDPLLLSLSRHFRCVAHVLNLAVQLALAVDTVAEPLKRLRAVAHHIGWSVQRSERFFDIQKRYAATLAGRATGEGTEEGGGQAATEGGGTWRKVPVDLRLIVDSDTRWGSTLEMVIRGLALCIPLTMFFDETTPGISKETREQWAKIRLSDAHWASLRELRDFLEPFDAITLFVEGSLYPTMAGVVPQYNMLLDILDKALTLPRLTPLQEELTKAAVSKLERHMGGGERGGSDCHLPRSAPQDRAFQAQAAIGAGAHCGGGGGACQGGPDTRPG